MHAPSLVPRLYPRTQTSFYVAIGLEYEGKAWERGYDTPSKNVHVRTASTSTAPSNPLASPCRARLDSGPVLEVEAWLGKDADRSVRG